MNITGKMIVWSLVITMGQALTQSVLAQQKAVVVNKVTTYLLPDGRSISADKLDSVRKAWGAEKVIMRHNDEDDSKGIIHLEKLTDQLQKEMAQNSASQQTGLSAMTGQPVIDFKLTDLKGREVELSKLKGKVVVINFWFVNCPPCITEMPELNRVAKSFIKKDVVFLAITFDDEIKVSNFLKTHVFDYEILPNARAVTNVYGIHNYPTHLVIGKDGQLKKYFVSGQDIGLQLEQTIREQNI